MKDVLISTQPKWVAKICNEIYKRADGTPVYEKEIEVRKTRPKIEVPFKCYIYETKGKKVECGFAPYIMIYRKPTAPKITRDLQRWCNNRFLFRSCSFEEYVPRKDGKTIKELYYSTKE